MTKYTILKAFEVKFSSQIWKIVVDPILKQIAVETRDQDSTLPEICFFDFYGKPLGDTIKLKEKDWTLEALQHRTIILKRIGDIHPVKEGIQLIDFGGKTRYISEEFTWVETYPDFLKIRHRSFQSGFEEYIDIAAAEKKTIQSNNFISYEAAIKMPVQYTGELPLYLKSIAMEDHPWVSRTQDKLLWSIHTKEKNNYNLNLFVANASNVLHVQNLLNDMPKMIPQPYFQIGNQIFLMTYNKREIVSYLV